MRSASMGVAAIALLAVLAWWRDDGNVKQAALATEPPAQDKGRVQAAELAALRARVARLEQQLSALHKASTPAGTSCSQPSSLESSPQRPSLVAAVAPPAPDLAATYDRDARPAQHTPRAAELTSRMRALLPADASLDRLECRGEICRAELTMPGIKRYHEFIKSAFGDPDKRVWSGSTKFGYVSEPDAQNWEHDEISVYAYLGPEAAGP